MTGHPEIRGWRARLGNYDPGEPLVVPYWTVLAAVGLAGTLGRALARGTIRLSEVETQLLGLGAWTADPLPGREAPRDRDALAELLEHLADTLRRSLPAP
jgi:hypothetical protein